MLQALYTAAAGIQAQVRATDALANDIANLNTPGYKTVQVSFRELASTRSAGGITTGSGSTVETSGRSWGQGTMRPTERALDIAIEGPGFFEVRRGDGAVRLTRNGSFQVDAQGRLTTAQGHLVLPGVQLPPGRSAADLDVAPDGVVRAAGTAVGAIRTVNVPRPDALRAGGDSLFVPSVDSGDPGRATTRLHQRALEASAADPTALVGGQRTLQFLSRIIQTQDQMLAVANGLRP